MLTKNQYIICLSLLCGGAMILGAGTEGASILAFADKGLIAFPLFSPSSAEFWGWILSLCLPLLRWITFLFLCGFCAFSAPVTLSSAGGCALALGRSFAAWHHGNCPFYTPLLLVPTMLFTATLAYRSFLFWNVLRDRHICRLYPTDHALLFRLSFQFFKIGGLFLLTKVLLIVFLAFLQ